MAVNFLLGLRSLETLGYIFVFNLLLCISFIVYWIRHLPVNSEARVRFPPRALLFYGNFFFHFLEIFLKSACRKLTAILEQNFKVNVDQHTSKIMWFYGLRKKIFGRCLLYHSPPWSYQPIPMTITLRLQSYPFVVLHSSRIPFGLFPAGTPPHTLHSLVRRRAYAIVCNDLSLTIVY